ncbi:MAG: hypothetical protein HQL82_11895 [Magnetococcales bacterium]|nr:hypothetical protein [Magnetococcales bacterium]
MFFDYLSAIRNTAYTRNWVWSRLSDGNDDHTPRFLLQLFNHAIAWEKEEQEKIRYDKSIIRPRALIECLGSVARDAIDSLREEFKEIDTLLEKLTRIGYSPVSREDLDDFNELIDLAVEIGLLRKYDLDARGNVARYKVPDIYRLGLGMTRKGQA